MLTVFLVDGAVTTIMIVVMDQMKGIAVSYVRFAEFLRCTDPIKVISQLSSYHCWRKTLDASSCIISDMLKC